MNGLILPDLPFQEKEDCVPVCTKYGISLILLAAPTSQKRIAMIAAAAEGFLYIVFSLGVTGTNRPCDDRGDRAAEHHDSICNCFWNLRIPAGKERSGGRRWGDRGFSDYRAA